MLSLVFVFSLFINDYSLLIAQTGWFQIPTSTSYPIWSMYFFNAETGFIAANDYLSSYVVQKTTNGGNNWVSQIAGSDYKMTFDIYFTNENTGYAIGGDVWLFINSGIYKTTNGGTNWYFSFLPDTTVYRSILFINSNTGYIAGSLGYARKTTNAGLNWNLLNTETSASLRSIFFLNSNTGFISGFGGTIIKTTNAGVNWTIINTGFIENLYSIYFIDANTGIAAGCDPGGSLNSIIIRTTNGGSNWTTQFSGSGYIYSLSFANQSTGFSANSNRFLRTVNRGINWDYIETPVNSGTIRSIKFINDTIGYAAGLTLFKTINGGMALIPNSPSNLSAYPQQYGKIRLTWVDNSVIEIGFKIQRKLQTDTVWQTKDSVSQNITQYTDTGIVIGIPYQYRVYAYNINGNSGFSNIVTASPLLIDIYSNHLPNNFYLYSNYPNPFNPITKIKFEIPLNKGGLKGIVSLKVYDLLGKEVTTLVNEQLQPGSYEVTFDGSNLPSGVYFYKLTAGNYTETMKMLMIK